MNIIKRKGREEKYDEKKVYGSVYSAALNCECKEKKAEDLALKVTKSTTAWIKKQKHVTSNEIKDFIINHLAKEDKHVALMYKHHLDLS